MKHLIMVKFIADADNKETLIGNIGELYKSWKEYKFINNCQLLTNCTDFSNRYDILIVLSLDKDDIGKWNECELHKKWKSDFGGYVAQKAIFDYE